MTLAFPNPTRAYDETRGLIRFIGHDGLNQVLFLLPVVLFDRDGATNRGKEHDYLLAFDRLRDRILATARQAYQSRRRHTIELDLSAFGSSLQSAT
ncbi:DUF1488 family protein [Rhizobium sp. 'Codium 1']|jgi:hypothetical protein|uniref:DUF1488 family protein n=1 Tax=Rhizobium sp. 'Codium 1' TaxID=2940484 RepID=UPI001E4CA073|nr:DUF1488 family protein [Rhizobium sp. 'Codium 1']MCC8931294.1 DUF1488 domain-containing protein [Rhizobium sp. 'Codium 1']